MSRYTVKSKYESSAVDCLPWLEPDASFGRLVLKVFSLSVI